MNIERNINEEMNSIAGLLESARTEYISGTVTNKSIPADYRVLFVLFRSVTVSGTTYNIAPGSIKEKIFYEAVNNFQHSVENFANKNVHIIPIIKEIDETVVSTISTYLQYSDVSTILSKIAPAGMYDAVITASAPNWEWGGGTLARMFYNSSSNGYSFYGYSGCAINTSNDTSAVGLGYDDNYPYLITTNVFIHEWMHQLEGFRNVLKVNGKNIIYPFTHAYYDNYQKSPTQDWMYKDNYRWNETYFNNTNTYPHVVERPFTSFYRAVLACDVEYIPDNNHKVGMYPEFWKITPSKIVIGRYIIQNAQSQYLYCTSSTSATLTSNTLVNETDYFWDVFYDISRTSNFLRRKSCAKRNYDVNCTVDNTTYTRVGPYDEGRYYIINKTKGKVLAFSVSGTDLSATIENYRSTDHEYFNLSYYSDCFYKVSPDYPIIKYLDLNNNWNTEGNTVNFHIWTGYYTAQTWQFRYINNSYDIMPMASTTRSLSYYDEKLHIVSTSNIQKWRLEQVNNGKFVFNGRYKIQDIATGRYLYANGSTLKLSTTATEWTVSAVGDNYYTISVISGGTTKYIDVLNAYDIEGNTVQVRTATAYDGAQNWKFMLNLDNSVTIVPKLSLDRGLKCTTSNSTLSTNFTRFKLIKV